MTAYPLYRWSARVRVAGREEVATGTLYRATAEAALRAAQRAVRAGWRDGYVTGSLTAKAVRR